MIGWIIVIGLFLLVFFCIAEAMKHSGFEEIRHILAFCISALGVIGLFGDSVVDGQIGISPLVNTILLPSMAVVLAIPFILLLAWLAQYFESWFGGDLDKEIDSKDREIKSALKKNKQRKLSHRQFK